MIGFFSTAESTRMQAMAQQEYEQRRIITMTPHWQWFEVCDQKYCLEQAKIHIRDKLAYPGSLSASLSQELIAAYPWLAYPVAYPVAASRRCGQRLGGGRRLAGRRRLGGGGASEPAAA